MKWETIQKACVTTLVTLANAAPVNSQNLIDTYTGVPHSGVCCFGISTNGNETYISTYGQTFRTDAVWKPSSASVWLADGVGGPQTLFKLFVMKWDPIDFHAIGDVLYTSEPRSGGTANPDQGESAYNRYDFDLTGMNELGAHQVFVLFLSTAGLRDQAPVMGANLSLLTIHDSYNAGQFVYSFPGDDFSMLSDRKWYTIGGIKDNGAKEDLGMILNGTSGPTIEPPPVTVTPEPMPMILICTGLAGVAAIGRRRLFVRASDHALSSHKS